MAISIFKLRETGKFRQIWTFSVKAVEPLAKGMLCLLSSRVSLLNRYSLSEKWHQALVRPNGIMEYLGPVGVFNAISQLFL